MKNRLLIILSIFVLSFSILGGMVFAVDGEVAKTDVVKTGYTISSTLKKGISGEDVFKLQDFLIKSEILEIEKPTGYFGTQTEQAVKELQDIAGLVPDGIVGQVTRNIIKFDPKLYTPAEKKLIVKSETRNPVLPDCASGDKFSALTGKPCDNASKSTVAGCEAGYKFSMLSGKPCDSTDIITTENKDSTDDADSDEDASDDVKDDEEEIATDEEEKDISKRIMYWWGKVNQHVDENGEWQTDPDGVSGANLDKLTYCKKWYPNTTKYEPYQLETINTWKERGNVNNWTSIKMSYLCLE